MTVLCYRNQRFSSKELRKAALGRLSGEWADHLLRERQIDRLAVEISEGLE